MIVWRAEKFFVISYEYENNQKSNTHSGYSIPPYFAKDNEGWS